MEQWSRLLQQGAIWIYRKTHSICIDFWKWAIGESRLQSSFDQNVEFPLVTNNSRGVFFKDTLVPVCVGITVCASPLRAIMDNVCDWAEEGNEICYLCTPAQTQYVDCGTDRKKGWKSFVAAIALWRQRDGEKMMADGFKRLLAWERREMAS